MAIRSLKQHRVALLSALLISMHIAGCGGGGDASAGAGGSTGSGGAGDTSPPALIVGALEPACESCAATSAAAYAGSGTGVWQAINSGSTTKTIPISISGLTGQEVQLILTNESATSASLPAGSIPSGTHLFSVPSSRIEDPAKVGIAEFNRAGWHQAVLETKSRARSLISAPSAATVHLVGDTKSFWHTDNTTRSSTLIKQVVASDGRQVNFWVETPEYASPKITDTILDILATKLTQADGVYDSLISVGGPLWGPHAYSELIDDTNRALDVVLLNFDNNNLPYGTIGYFFGIHNFLHSEIPTSNESLSIYLDTETLYHDGNAGLETGILTLAHELMHMSNFYRRGINISPLHAFDTWLNEMTAMAMEDLVAHQMTTFNPIRDLRLPQYVGGGGLGYSSFQCALTTWTPYSGACESYAVSGSFGGFLVRQLGLAFLKNLLTQSEADSKRALDAAVKVAEPTSSMAQQFRRFTASAAGVIPTAGAPTGFGFPARSEGGFSVPAIDAFTLKNQRVLPTAVPTTIPSLAILPVVRQGVTGTYTDSVKLPPGTSLSVVIH
jgi:hypothetical protein